MIIIIVIVTVNCFYWPEHSIFCFNFLIYIITGPLPPPTNIMATVISQFSFTVVWDLVTSNCVSIVTYEIVADSADCGTCTVNTGTPSATCTGWTPRGQNCSVRVRALQDLCGGVSGVFSVPLILLLKGTPV